MPDYDDAITQCDTILRLIDEAIEDSSPKGLDKGADFLENVRRKVSSFQEHIEAAGRVTVGQERALNSMENGVRARVH